MHKKNLIRITIGTSLILLIPFVAMQFTNNVNWDVADFIVMGILIFGAGLTLDLVSKNVNKRYRTPILIAVALIFLWLWAELAVGVFTNWGS